MLAILLCCLAAQGPAPATAGPGAEAIRGDLEFVRAVEESVMAAHPGRRPPEPFRSLIDRLGSDRWRDRDEASRALQAASGGDPMWLFWGRLSRDPEVRIRCNAILRRLNPCPACKGSGVSKNWESWPCWDCQGTSTAWPWSAWD